ncbi:DctQ TRAP-type C4-dicarboxylate transport system, large permease component [Rhabdaerophilaceae bacterium]
MSGSSIALIGFAVMLAAMALRMPIGLSMLVVGGVGYSLLNGLGPFLAYMKTNTYHQFANYTLSVIPLFILMGALAERAGIATALFKAAERGFGRMRGGLGMAVIGACTAFGAICGSSVATTATFGRAALPELTRFGYDRGFSTGTIAIGGTLGILIPPSVILVVYAITTEQNIAKLFQAALIPGLMAAVSYCIVIAIRVRQNPALAPDQEAAVVVVAPRPRWLYGVSLLLLAAVLAGFASGSIETTPAVLGGLLALLIAFADVSILPALAIALIVVGGIYGGVFTPTEGAAVGAIAMLAAGILTRSLTFEDVREALRQTAITSGMIFIILLGAEVFGAFLALSRVPMLAAEWVAGLGLSPYLVLVGMLAFYILLGAVMDELAMILLTLPVFFPVIQGLEFGMFADDVAIWFGILVLIVVGIGLTAPPIGLNVFVIHQIAKTVPLVEIYRGVLPFIAADIVRLGIVVTFPATALWLVRILN